MMNELLNRRVFFDLDSATGIPSRPVGPENVPSLLKQKKESGVVARRRSLVVLQILAEEDETRSTQLENFLGRQGFGVVMNVR